MRDFKEEKEGSHTLQSYPKMDGRAAIWTLLPGLTPTYFPYPTSHNISKQCKNLSSCASQVPTIKD